VATFPIGPIGDALAYVDSGVMHGCHVGDYRNWSCPAVTTTDGGIDASYGFFQAIDGTIEVTEPKKQVVPIPWYRWELDNVDRFLGLKAKDTKK
jgi:hypothetical protein